MPFTLAEDAYRVLKTYLDHLLRYYSGKEGGFEVVDGIEERIAELLAERTDMGAHVVSKADIDNVLEIIGPPEVIEEESEGTGLGTYKNGLKPPKKLYRDIDHKIAGGVCSGLAAYLNIDVIIIRVLYLAFLFIPSVIHVTTHIRHWGFLGFNFPWFFVLLYLIMWIIIPAARTVEEKYAMRGEPLSARGVQRSRRSSTVPRYSYEPKSVSAERNRFWGVLGRIFAVLVGLFFLISSSVVLIAIIVAFFATGYALHFFPTALLDIVAFPADMFWFKTFTLLTLIIPALGFIHLGSVLVFNIKGHRWIGATLFFVWLASLIGLVLIGSREARNFRYHATFDESIPLELTSDTLYIEMESQNDFMFERYWLHADNSHYKLGWIDGDRHNVNLVAFPPLTIVRQAESETPSVLVRSRSFGRSEYSAKRDAESLKPILEVNENVLFIHAIEVTRDNPWEGNTASLRLYVPGNQVIIVRKPVYHEFGVSRSRKVNIIRSK
ncbi:MAG: PspC domain protein [Bacteroidetes bacterium ADurb.Bin037]|nr:MAG: PspC domain protein [Bacteroidetes bacterium ADurb.Bin037]